MLPTLIPAKISWFSIWSSIRT